jgi:hypothetical protein
VIGATEPHNRRTALDLPPTRAERQRHVRAQQAAAVELRACELEALDVPAKERQVLVCVQNRPRALQPGAIGEVDRLRQLDDAVTRKALDDAFPELLVRLPHIAEVPAAVQEDHAVPESIGQRLPVVGGQVAHIGDVEPVCGQPPPLAEPDRTVADVGVCREIEEGTPRARRQQRPEHAVDRPRQLVHDRIVDECALGRHQRRTICRRDRSMKSNRSRLSVK